MRLLLLACSLIISIFGCSKQVNPFRQIVQTQLQRYPQMQVQDLYKLVYQAAMGNIHLGVDPAILEKYLVDELGEIQASDKEPLFEEISADGVVRVNLRPFKAKGGDSMKLFEAMMQTADSFNPRKAKIKEYWKVIEEMADDRSLPFSRTKLDSFFVTMQDQDFPSTHHSEQYTSAYRPSYRVILKIFLPTLD